MRPWTSPILTARQLEIFCGRCMSPSLGFRHAASLTASPMMVQIQMIPYQFELLPQIDHNILMAFKVSGIHVAQLHHICIQIRVSPTFDFLRSCGPFIQFCRFKSRTIFISIFGHAWSKTRRMACLTLQQSELSRSDIASTRLLCDPGVSNF